MRLQGWIFEPTILEIGEGAGFVAVLVVIVLLGFLTVLWLVLWMRTEEKETIDLLASTERQIADLVKDETVKLPNTTPRAL